MYQEELKIPGERVAVLIGKKGENKSLLEKKLKVKLKISQEGDVLILGGDSLKVYTCKLVIQAIGRGFSPEVSLNLLNENCCLEIIDISNYCGKSKNKQIRVKSRLIGTKGKAKKMIERLTNTDICIYGKTVSVIGETEKVLLAKKALEQLIQGSKHGNVYAFIEKQKIAKL